MNEGRVGKYDIFWENCAEYISECSAVPERCHGEVCFMAKAISVRDLINQISKQCPPGTPVPSESWVTELCSKKPPCKGCRTLPGKVENQTCSTKTPFLEKSP